MEQDDIRAKSVRSKGSLQTHRKSASSHPSTMPQRNESNRRRTGGRSAFCARRDKKMPPERPWKTTKTHAFASTKSSPSFHRLVLSPASCGHASGWRFPKNWKETYLHRHRTRSCQRSHCRMPGRPGRPPPSSMRPQDRLFSRYRQCPKRHRNSGCSKLSTNESKVAR